MKITKKALTVLLLLFVSILPTFALEGEVISVSGKVEIDSPAGWVSLKEGDVVETGYVISTGFRSKAVIKVAGSLMTVDALTRLTLEQLNESSDAHSSEVFLDLGSISANVKKAENKRVNFQVNTPVATASVRGTEFAMGLNSLTVIDGAVSYVAKKNDKKVASNVVEEEEEESEDTAEGESGGQEMIVSKGNTSTITSSGTASNPVTNKVNNALGIVSDAESTGPVSASSAAADTVKSVTVEVPTTADVTVTFSAE